MQGRNSPFFSRKDATFTTSRFRDWSADRSEAAKLTETL